ncbi:MAG: metabolite traffic protein EboE [Eudoraea sp.]
MILDDTYHLSYCTNIHPGQDWQSTFQSLETYLPLIKAKVAEDKPFGVGLRLSNKASEELSQHNRLELFKKWLISNNLYVFTMNGFPYGNFHNEVVKDKVHYPDWTTQERVNYTLRLFDQLAYLLPEGMSGGISTSPISYKHWHPTAEDKIAVLTKGANHLFTVIAHLYQIEEDTGKYLHLDIEPEPDGILENTEDVLYFFQEFLVPIVSEKLIKTYSLNKEEAQKIILRYCTLCYDICHFSLAYEEPIDTFNKLKEAGIKIGKIQVSAALKVLFDEGDNTPIWEALGRFDEPVYLHQVTEKTEEGVITYNDLPKVLKNKKSIKELRAHFHVPIFLESFDQLYSTQDHILKVISILKEDKITEHLEIETYTWDVLPLSLKKELSDSIIRELLWFKHKF